LASDAPRASVSLSGTDPCELAHRAADNGDHSLSTFQHSEPIQSDGRFNRSGQAAPRGAPDAVGSQEAHFSAAAAILAAQPERSEPDASAVLLGRHYGLAGKITTLSSEVERTAEVQLPDGDRLILKTSTRREAPDSFGFQAAALAGLEGAGGFVVPRLVPTASGGRTFEDAGICGYLQTRIDGAPLHREVPTPDLLFRTGCALARLDKALEQIEPPAVHRPVLWHIGFWAQLMSFEQYLPAGGVAHQVRSAMANFADAIAPQLANLPWQVTHNDPSPFNTIVTDLSIGFIDFGDGCWNPRIQDLAIAASHMVTDPSLPLGGAEHLIAGYASVIPLSGLETKLLVGLMRARQSALILINAWRSHLFPEDAEYINKNVGRAERGLAILTRLDPAPAEAAVIAAASSPQPAM
jgi:Ser/Thr protein kinase RdoA (MazF antagonist)